MAMEEKQTPALPPPATSTLRWKLLRQSLLRQKPGNDQSDSESINRVSRKTKCGFNLIPFRPVESHSVEVDSSSPPGNSRDAQICYTLPTQPADELFLFQRTGSADINDFEICNKYDIDNTGLVCSWPSEDVLAYYCLSHTDMFRAKKVIELGSGYGLAGLVIAIGSEASEVVVSDGNPQRSVAANSTAFGSTRVSAFMLHWNKEDFDTFFKEFHQSLVRTVKLLLKNSASSEAIFFSPRRGNSLDTFLGEVESSGLHYSISENYDPGVIARLTILVDAQSLSVFIFNLQSTSIEQRRVRSISGTFK
ncbi:hypothetical protein V2J09_021529 [Rumex salicifolius]